MLTNLGKLKQWTPNSFILVITIFALFSCSNKVNNASEPPETVAMNPIALKFWIRLEIEFMERLRNIDRHLLKNKPFTSLLKRYTDAVSGSGCQLETYSWGIEANIRAKAMNPIATYKSLRRIAYFLPDLRAEMKEYHEELFTQFPTNWITPDAVDDAIMAILRIQLTYVLRPTQLSEGVVSGVQTGEKLDALHCYELGLFASSKGYHAIGIEWLEEALSKSVHDHSVDKGLIVSALRSAITKHDELFDNRGAYDANFYDQKLKPIQAIPDFKDIRKMQRLELLEFLKDEENNDAGSIRFWEICRNGSLEQFRSRLELSCWYDSNSHPYWAIAPLKVEKLAEDPDVYQVYDIIQDGMIEKVKQHVENELHRAEIEDTNSDPGATTFYDGRTSVSAWILEEDFPELAPIPRIIEMVTGLRVRPWNSAEQIQIGAYTFGGHYEPHLDHLFHEGEAYTIKGGRIVTLMFYLSDPELGGNTAFIKAGTSARPIKGSAVIWHNLWPNSEADYSTLHAACPVILGEKWVANKWIRMHDQFLVRPCPLDQEERFRFSLEDSSVSYEEHENNAGED